MKKRQVLTAITVLLCVLSVTLLGCTKQIKSTEISVKKTAMSAEARQAANAFLTSADNKQAYLNFTSMLLSESYDNANSLTSPLSVYLAMSMLTNGAAGNTLTEITNLLGMSVEGLNNYCGGLYADYMEGNIKGINLANSIWIKKGYEIKQSFLDVNSTYYGASVYLSDFDKRTIKDINNWVSNNTDGMIKEIIDSLPERAMMALVNTLLFEMKWAAENYSYVEADFAPLIGGKHTAQFITDGTNTGGYARTDDAQAFRLYFENSRFSFLGILPDEDVDYNEYVKGFSGTELSKLLHNTDDYSVRAYVPKFKYDFSINLNEILNRHGMREAFTDNADFSGICDQICVSDVIHKTAIELDKNGVKAAAATVIINKATSAGPGETVIELRLDRPFMFCILDNTYDVPLFIGAVTKV